MRRLAWLLLLLPLVLAGPARAQDLPAAGQVAQGWWSALHPAGLPALPAAPDVGATDLLLQGGDPQRLLPDTGVIDQQPQPTSLAALRFRVTPSATVGALVVQVATGAQAMDVRAYPTTSPWIPVQDGVLSQAPVPDLSRYSAGRLSPDGLSLDFPDIGRLVPESGVLSVVLVAGPLDRVVVHAVTARSLGVQEPVVTDPTSPAIPPAPAVLPVLPRADGPLVGPPPTSADVAPVAVPEVVLPAPQAAPAPTAVVGQALRTVVGDDDRSRVIALAEALLVLVFFGLLGQGPLRALAVATDEVDGERGLGRFRTTRSGPVPRL